MATETRQITPTQDVRIQKAKAVTAAQLQSAKELTYEFFGHDNPQMVVAVLQALATNYAATVAASKD
jgi:hypothetical protein